MTGTTDPRPSTTLPVDDLRRLVESGGSPRLIDVRPPGEFETAQVRLLAGSIVLAAVLLSAVVPPAKWIAGLIGAGLAVAALSGTCAMGMLLARLPYNQGPRTDLAGVIRSLAADRP